MSANPYSLDISTADFHLDVTSADQPTTWWSTTPDRLFRPSTPKMSTATLPLDYARSAGAHLQTATILRNIFSPSAKLSRAANARSIRNCLIHSVDFPVTMTVPLTIATMGPLISRTQRATLKQSPATGTWSAVANTSPLSTVSQPSSAYLLPGRPERLNLLRVLCQASRPRWQRHAPSRHRPRCRRRPLAAITRSTRDQTPLQEGQAVEVQVIPARWLSGAATRPWAGFTATQSASSLASSATAAADALTACRLCSARVRSLP